MVGQGLEVYKGLIYLWWDLARYSEEKITQSLQRANVRTTESEIHDALEEWGFLSFPSPDVSPQDTDASMGTRHTSNFLNDGLPAFLEAYGKPEPCEDSENEDSAAAIERFRRSEEDSTSWYTGTRHPILPEDDAVQATYQQQPAPANSNRNSTARENRIDRVVDRIEELLPEIDDEEDNIGSEEEALLSTLQLYKANYQTKSSTLSHQARQVQTPKVRKREMKKKESVEKEESATVEAEAEVVLDVEAGEPREEWRESSVAASQGSGYDSAKRLRRFSVSEDEEVLVAKIRKVSGELGGSQAGGLDI